MPNNKFSNKTMYLLAMNRSDAGRRFHYEKKSGFLNGIEENLSEYDFSCIVESFVHESDETEKDQTEV